MTVYISIFRLTTLQKLRVVIQFIGWIYLIYNIWNAINDPLLGVWVDRLKYNEKRGKYVYLLKCTAPLMLLSIFGMLFSSPSWNDWAIFGVLLAELFVFDTAYTVYSVAYQSYFLIAAPSKEERVDVDIIRTFIGNALGAITTIIPTLRLTTLQKLRVVILDWSSERLFLFLPIIFFYPKINFG